MSKRSKLIIFYLSILAVSTAFLWFVYRNRVQVNYVVINGAKITVQIADTGAERSQGLSDVDSLCSNCGMLFVFFEPVNFSFWMKDMHFSLDIIWISDGKVIGCSEKLPAEGHTPKKRYYAPGWYDQVLEVNAGTCSQLNIQSGDEVFLVN